jgi:MFS family permease
VTGLATLLSRRGEPSRRARRLIVIVAFAVIPLAVAALWLTADVDWPWQLGLPFFLAVLAALCLPLLALQDFRRNVMRRPLADERERRRRDEAYRISYRIVEIGVVVGFLAVGVFRDEIAAIIALDWYLVVWPLYAYLIFLPYAVFAWREPDAVDDEAD